MTVRSVTGDPASWSTTSIEDRELPACFRTEARFLALPSSDLRVFLDQDLCVERINRVSSYLWLVGRPYSPRPINIQLVLDRALTPTTDASLHLVWTSKRIFLKPLPRYLLSDTFYKLFLDLPHPHGLALGLLQSYLALVPTELDFDLARDAHLFPSGYKWEDWRALTRRVLDDYPGDSVYDHVPVRYRYGELRLTRLDKIYRLRHGELLHGYSNLTGPNSYVDFFVANHIVVTAAIVYVIVVLTAMQVGLAIDGLRNANLFQRACYGFSIFAMVAPIFVMGSVVAIFVVAFFANWCWTATVHRAERRRSMKRDSVP